MQNSYFFLCHRWKKTRVVFHLELYLRKRSRKNIKSVRTAGKDIDTLLMFDNSAFSDFEEEEEEGEDAEAGGGSFFTRPKSSKISFQMRFKVWRIWKEH